MTHWTDRFDRLLKAMSQGEPHRDKRTESRKLEKPVNEADLPKSSGE